jgi:hypothetical protein
LFQTHGPALYDVLGGAIPWALYYVGLPDVNSEKLKSFRECAVFLPKISKSSILGGYPYRREPGRIPVCIKAFLLKTEFDNGIKFILKKI